MSNEFQTNSADLKGQWHHLRSIPATPNDVAGRGAAYWHGWQFVLFTWHKQTVQVPPSLKWPPLSRSFLAGN